MEYFFKNGPIQASFSLFCLFNTGAINLKITIDWIGTMDLLSERRPSHQLCHCAKGFLLKMRNNFEEASIWLQYLGAIKVPNAIDAVNQGNWSLSIKLRLECFVIVE